MKRLLLYTLLFAHSFILAQDYGFVVRGKIIDNNLMPIPDVKINTSSNQTTIRSNEKGEFKLKINYPNDRYIVFNHVGYINDTLFFSARKAKKYAKKGEVKLSIKLSELVFKEVIVTATRVDTVYGNPLFSIQDYMLLEDDQLLLLTYSKSLKKDGKLILTDAQQQIITEYTIPDQPRYLYKDYAGTYFLVCTAHVYHIRIHRQQIKLTPILKEDFYGFYQRIIDTIQDDFYYSNFSENYPAVDFLVTNRTDSAHHKLCSVQDDFMMELYRAQYKYVSGREKLWAYRKEQETGIDKEIWIGAASFTQDFLYKPVYAPLFIREDTVLIFDQYKNYIFKFDSDHDLVDSIPFQLKIKGSKEKWEQPLIKDQTTQDIYALYNKGGYYYLKQFDLNTGKTIQTLKLSNRYVDQLTIKDNYVYYIYRPFESLQKKYLYREELVR
ncbi:MAG: carboxypeptidase-like regulatory domain-containing protein [Flavobacteriales bacterium]|jgi:hypothetical protein|nr:carboxypeptidase-like regulatory domain-containing protein [Flavobacteriales bacterium]